MIMFVKFETNAKVGYTYVKMRRYSLKYKCTRISQWSRKLSLSNQLTIVLINLDIHWGPSSMLIFFIDKLSNFIDKTTETRVSLEH